MGVRPLSRLHHDGAQAESISMRRLVLLVLLGLTACAGALRPPADAPRRRTSRRALLFSLPAIAVLPATANAAATGGGFVGSEFNTVGGGPPKLTNVPKLTKGEPKPEELQRLVLGYQRLQYLLDNWEKETTICIKGCKGKYESCGCTRDPAIVQAYMGYKSMEDPLFKAGDLMLRASTLIESDAEFQKYNDAMEKWNNKAE